MNAPVMVVLILLLIPGASALRYEFLDAAGDQGPYPSSYDILSVAMVVENETIDVGMGLAAWPQVRTHFVVDLFTETRQTLIQCTVGPYGGTLAAPIACRASWVPRNNEAAAGTSNLIGILDGREDAVAKQWNTSLSFAMLEYEVGTRIERIRALSDLTVATPGAPAGTPVPEGTGRTEAYPGDPPDLLRGEGFILQGNGSDTPKPTQGEPASVPRQDAGGPSVLLVLAGLVLAVATLSKRR